MTEATTPTDEPKLPEPPTPAEIVARVLAEPKIALTASFLVWDQYNDVVSGFVAHAMHGAGLRTFGEIRRSHQVLTRAQLDWSYALARHMHLVQIVGDEAEHPQALLLLEGYHDHFSEIWGGQLFRHVVARYELAWAGAIAEARRGHAARAERKRQEAEAEALGLPAWQGSAEFPVYTPTDDPA